MINICGLVNGLKICIFMFICENFMHGYNESYLPSFSPLTCPISPSTYPSLNFMSLYFMTHQIQLMLPMYI